MSILYFERIVPHYRIDIFRKLSKKNNVIICHSKEREKSTLKDASELIDFQHYLLPRLYFGKKETLVIQNPLPPIFKHKPKIIISEFALNYLTLWLLFLLRPIFRYKLILHTHGIKNELVSNPYKGLWSKIAFFLYNKADAIIFYDSVRKTIVEKKIKFKDKLFVAANTLNTEKMTSLFNEFEKKGRDNIKRKLGFNNKFNLIYIGRLIKDKNIELLLDVFSELSKDLDIGLHIIGNGPEKDSIIRYQKKIQGINHYGEIYDDNIVGEYLYAADLNVNLGYVGLSIVHSFCYGTPMLTCRGVNHSPEIAYLIDNYNGSVCDLKKDDIVKKLNTIFNNEELLCTYSKNAYNTAINDLSLDRMIQGFSDAINFVDN